MTQFNIESDEQKSQTSTFSFKDIIHWLRLTLKLGASDKMTGAIETNGEKPEKIIILPSKNPDAPMVVLFGWAGCRDRYLSKYSQIYEKNGLTVVRYTASIKKVRSFDSYREFAKEVYDKLFAGSSPISRPVFFHMFSMNGCSLFAAMWELLGKVKNGAEIKKHVHGVIYDSSPANVTPWKGAKAVAFATLPPALGYGDLTRLTYQVVLSGLFGFHRSLIWLKSFWEKEAFENNFAYFKILKMEDLPKNQLFLYSLADDICTPGSIEEFQAVQKMKGKKVVAQCWHDSLHVEHLRSYQDEYSKLCLDFTDVPLNNNRRDSTTEDLLSHNKREAAQA
uniref:Transmembrane protein 53 n=1 Tax=Acrobeloides nanus TaxID=290746 RepID=A0A914DNN2_9BILA